MPSTPSVGDAVAPTEHDQAMLTGMISAVLLKRSPSAIVVLIHLSTASLVFLWKETSYFLIIPVIVTVPWDY